MFLDNIKNIWIKKELLESFCSLSVLNVLNLILPLITLPYLIHVIGIEKYGIYSFAYTIIQYILLVSTYGFNLSATKLISEKRTNHEYISEVFNSVIICRLLLALFIYLIFLFISLFVSIFSDTVCIVSYGLGIVLGDVLTPIWLFQGMGKMRYITIVNALSKILFTVLIFVFILTEEDYKFILLINSLGYLFAAIAGLFISRRIFNIHFSTPSYKTILFQFKDGLHIFLSTIGINLYRNSNILLLGIFSTEYILGIYSAAEKLIKGAQGVISPVTDALFPYLSKRFSDSSSRFDNINLLFRISKILFFIYLFIVLIFYVLSPAVVSYLFPDNIHREIMELLYIMTPIILLGGLGYVFGILGLYGIGKKQSFLKCVILSGFTSIIILVGTVNIVPLYAGGFAMLGSELILCLLSFYILKTSYKSER
jgi:PST family polysaccharide transporter